MADEADLAMAEEEFALRLALEGAKQQAQEGRARGVCLYCGEACEPNAVLHDYCREDYEAEQRAKRIAGRPGG